MRKKHDITLRYLTTIIIITTLCVLSIFLIASSRREQTVTRTTEEDRHGTKRPPDSNNLNLDKYGRIKLEMNKVLKVKSEREVQFLSELLEQKKLRTRSEVELVPDEPRWWIEQDLMSNYKKIYEYSYIPIDRIIYGTSIKKSESIENPVKYAFASFLKFSYLTPEYLKGLLTLIVSWRNSKSRFPFVVYTVGPVPASVETGLTRLGVTIEKGEPLIRDYNVTIPDHIRNSFDKFIAWKLTKFHKLVLLDSNSMILKNVDELLGFPELSGTLDYCRGCVAGNNGSGVLIMDPDETKYSKIKSYLLKTMSQSQKEADEPNVQFFSKDVELNKLYQLPYIYNAKPSLCDCRGRRGRGEWVKFNETEVKIMNWVCEEKPWMEMEDEKWMKLATSDSCRDRYIWKWKQYYQEALEIIGANDFSNVFDPETLNKIKEEKQLWKKKTGRQIREEIRKIVQEKRKERVTTTIEANKL